MKPDPERDDLLGRLAARELSPAGGAAGDDCPDAELLAAYVDGSLPRGAREEAERHFAACARCQEVLAAVARGETERPEARSEPALQRFWSWRWRWLAPLATAATVAALWVVVRPALLPPAPAAPETPQMVRADATEQPGGPAAVGETLLRTAPPNELPAPGTRAGRESGPGDQARAARRESGGPAQAKSSETVVPPAAATGAARAVRPGKPETSPASSGPAEDEAPWTIVRSPDPSVLWRLGRAGAIERSLEGGRVWTLQAGGMTAELVAGSAPTPLVCWAVGKAGVVLRTIDGTAWEQVQSPTTQDLYAVSARDALTATIVAADGRAFATTDGGTTWGFAPH